jgi:hypothetical protein
VLRRTTLRARERRIFKDIVADLLFPLLPGTQFGEPVDVEPPRRNREHLVTQTARPTELKIALSIDPTVCCKIRRAKPFSAEEKNVISCFLHSINRIYEDWKKPYREDSINSVMSEIVSSCISADCSKLIQRVISILSNWSQQTYEGQRIAFSVGVETRVDIDGGVDFMELIHKDFLKVVSNGHDTLLCISGNGCVSRHETLEHPDDSEKLFSPVRYAPLAHWTKSNENVVVALNRNGEILLFKKGQICFAKRRGSWRYFAHKSVLQQFTDDAMSKRSSIDLRMAIYLTSLDVAFARTGGCIGVINSDMRVAFSASSCISNMDNFGDSANNQKAKTLRCLIAGKKFQELSRLFRLELVSIDGSTIIDHSGRFISAGAIISVEGGSPGGGRQLAAETISVYGIGIKISNDGYISVINKQRMEIAKLS